MINTTTNYNRTQLDHYWTAKNITAFNGGFALPHRIFTAKEMSILLLVVLLTSFNIFLFFVIVIFHIFLTKSHLRENVRYILFINLLFTESVTLLFAVLLFIAGLYLLFMPTYVCCVVSGIPAISAMIAPYNLALMSWERYVAICYPLRHGVICTIHRCYLTIILTWVVGAVPIITELLAYFEDNWYFSFRIICVWKFLEIFPVQIRLRFTILAVSFAGVAIIIVYTYIQVMLVARKAGTQKSSVSKAGRTVLLHGFQLILCLLHYTNTFTENFHGDPNLLVINFYLTICLPHYVAPLVYGFRDEKIRQNMGKLLRCK